MLVLTRKEGEGIIIGDNIRISIIEVKGKQVRIGISAPKELMIHRDEVYEKIVKENILAANPDTKKIIDIIGQFKPNKNIEGK